MAKISAFWRDFPLGECRRSNFSPQEVASKGEGELLIDPAGGARLVMYSHPQD